MMKIMRDLMKNGGLVLHGEQEFHCHQSVQCGEVLHWRGKITDIYARKSKVKVMTFVVADVSLLSQDGEVKLNGTTRVLAM